MNTIINALVRTIGWGGTAYLALVCVVMSWEIVRAIRKGKGARK